MLTNFNQDKAYAVELRSTSQQIVLFFPPGLYFAFSLFWYSACLHVGLSPLETTDAWLQAMDY